jgi:hypothetical protein
MSMIGLLKTIKESAACSAISGESKKSVMDALERGRYAAQHGCCLPLPPLLDIWSILDSPSQISGRYGKRNQEAVSYDEWLADFCWNICRRYLLEKEREYCLPLLLNVWPYQNDSSNDFNKWEKTYNELLFDENSIGEICGYWSNGRNFETELWRKWWPNNIQEVNNEKERIKAAIMWSHFTSANGNKFVHEQFNHHAAEFYINADDFQPLSDQNRRIKKLIRQKRENINPETTSYEIQTRYYGQIMLQTLCYGVYGEFKIVNRSDPKIGTPPTNFPRRKLHVHLCWANGYTGIDTSVIYKTNTDSGSILQGLMGLLIDDWREKLKDLPMYYHLHRAWPSPMSVDIEKGGRKWNNLGKFSMPPANVTNILFRRNTYIDLSRKMKWDIKSDKLSNNSGWWCACVLSCDLPELGFIQTNQDGIIGQSIWKGNDSVLPEYISHVMVIDSCEKKWSICQVKNTELILLRKENNDDLSFCSLRRTALDLLLNLLEKYLR